MARFRHTASFGKRQEFVVIAELLKRGYDIYLTLVDDQQIDCVIRYDNGKKIQYFDVQIKARSSDCIPANAAEFAGINIQSPRKNYFFIFYSEAMDQYWIMSSLNLKKLGYESQKGESLGKYRVKLARHLRTENRFEENPLFRKFVNDFDAFRRVH